MSRILGLDTLLTQMIFLFGLSLLVGNGYAWFRYWRLGNQGSPIPSNQGTVSTDHERTEADDREENIARGEFRKGRTLFLMGVGLVIATWGLASLLYQPNGG